uniref:Succinate dehydrogenase ubiquinone iron-sulfur subunit n=1 Tax=Rhizophora mucronata TaxID=61149 RepID=A0A2P2Q3J5_RHIMU
MICFPGLNPLGQALEQFNMVWQRYSLNSSFIASSRSLVYSSRLSLIHLLA